MWGTLPVKILIIYWLCNPDVNYHILVYTIGTGLLFIDVVKLCMSAITQLNFCIKVSSIDLNNFLYLLLTYYLVSVIDSVGDRNNETVLWV